MVERADEDANAVIEAEAACRFEHRDLSGLAEDAKFFLAIGYRVANADKIPEWREGNEFKAIRDRSLGRQ